ncbi:tyrosine-type recombinase/integrase [Yinghuangia sp. ASG 101]|uniref:tyrosine-type recombinase/integrase n=1 Tax=Yinghuangia sp. ASG 101 TaxID=2896848 RepID=UPI001E55FDEF|nr:tyrosine-type recombinase/integrase [Yinghuangia sp. ASG 101]UGQ10040.1 tyrosine-type recombinase/integrase [Yinghuangia sp. ASG 101]
MFQPTFKVRIWAVRQRKDRGQTSAEVLWKVGANRCQETYATKTLADGRRSDLLQAVNRGEPFDELSGLPMSEARRRADITWYAHAREFAKMKWPRSSATARTKLAKGLASASAELLAKKNGSPDTRELSRALYVWGFNVSRWDQEPPEDVKRCLDWVAQHSLPMSALQDAGVIRELLTVFSLKLDGKPAAKDTFEGKRAVFRNAVGYAMEKNRITENPLERVQWDHASGARQVEPACVVNPRQARLLLARVYAQSRRGRHLAAFFGCMYFAGMRTGEVIRLRLDDCELPKHGWGVLNLRKSGSRVGKAWTDSGNAHDDRGLKARDRGVTRPVPIPPALVAMLRWHVYRYGTAADGRLFRSALGKPVQDSAYRAEWNAARKAVLTPSQVDSPLGKRPYDLRHACVSFWLNSGVDPTEVARRAGQSVAVLLRVYAKCLDGATEQANARIEAGLGRWEAT